VYLLYELRKLGFNAVIYEAGNDLGGTWRWNNYPGARVDSEVPEYVLTIRHPKIYRPFLVGILLTRRSSRYEYSIPEVFKDWTWTTNYPNYEE